MSSPFSIYILAIEQIDASSSRLILVNENAVCILEDVFDGAEADSLFVNLEREQKGNKCSSFYHISIIYVIL